LRHRDPYDRNESGRSNNRDNRDSRYDNRAGENRDQRNQRDHHDRRYDNGNAYNDRAPGPFYYGARSPEFRRGAQIPSEYRNHQYYVNDWRSYHLSAPPRGYQWVQVGGDYVLIALATGLIANLILNN
jgi:Ni/Co efflux regulator RcnB